MAFILHLHVYTYLYYCLGKRTKGAIIDEDKGKCSIPCTSLGDEKKVGTARQIQAFTFQGWTSQASELFSLDINLLFYYHLVFCYF